MQPSYEVLIKLANVFKVSVDSLLLNRTEKMMDVSGLNPAQISILENLITYFRKSELMDVFYSGNQDDMRAAMQKYSNMFENN